MGLLMKYNKNRSFYLLEQEEILKNQGGSLYKANQENYLELLKYKVQLQDHKYSENRQKYFSELNILTLCVRENDMRSYVPIHNEI